MNTHICQVFLFRIMENVSVSNDKSKQNAKGFSKACECGKYFTARSSYFAHKKACSVSIMSKTPSGKFICKEKDCIFRCRHSNEFLEHLKKIHRFQLENESTKDFQNYPDFLIWKEEYEKDTKSAFIRKKSYNTTTGKSEYFHCNRSGSYKSQSKGLRNMRSQGLRKIGASCPATLKVVATVNPEKITLLIQSFHYGHDNELAHMSISNRYQIEMERQRKG